MQRSKLTKRLIKMSPESGSWWCWNMLKRVETCWNMAGPRSYSWLFQPLAGPRPANRLERWRRRVVLSGGCTKLRQFSYVVIEKIHEKYPEHMNFVGFCWISQILLCPTYGFPPRWMVAWVTAGSCLGGILGRSILRPPWGRALCLFGPLEPLRVEGPEIGKHRGVGESDLSALMWRCRIMTDHALSHTYVIIWLYVYR